MRSLNEHTPQYETPKRPLLPRDIQMRHPKKRSDPDGALEMDLRLCLDRGAVLTVPMAPATGKVALR